MSTMRRDGKNCESQRRSELWVDVAGKDVLFDTNGHHLQPKELE